MRGNRSRWLGYVLKRDYKKNSERDKNNGGGRWEKKRKAEKEIL